MHSWGLDELEGGHLDGYESHVSHPSPVVLNDVRASHVRTPVTLHTLLNARLCPRPAHVLLA